MKRIQIKIGDVFLIETEAKQYVMQYIADDATCLNSRVVCVYKNEVSTLVNVYNNLASLQVYFYVHIDIKRGIAENLWQKLARAPLLNHSQVYFRSPLGFTNPDLPNTEWNVWKMNNPLIKVIDLTPEQKQYFYGDILLPSRIITKLQTGSFGMKYASLG
jgi:hypothetical protein